MTNSKEKDHWSFFKIAQALPYLFTTEFKHILELYITFSCKKTAESFSRTFYYSSFTGFAVFTVSRYSSS